LNSELENQNTELRLLLDTLHQDPTNLENRMVFADWLESNGDPRSELVRKWAEPQPWPVTDSAKLINDARPKLGGVDWGDWIGGFATGIRANNVEILQQNIEVLESVHLLYSLTIWTRSETLKLSLPDLQWLGKFVATKNLIWLDLTRCSIEPEHFRYFVESQYFGALHRLELPPHRFSNHEINEFLNRNNFPELQVLRATRGRFSKGARRDFGKRFIGQRLRMPPMIYFI